ncbi:putative membrane protein YdjX (TVP38/TMEM64 family) [Salirhabdus euzebyi]|uniref:TVP38/TMEM64 family membrane protein n=1 Tax=Salirhabdus euzebyi TaxID=394506 RepID=A0A841PTD3_9BACI|nr:VTT domain-containing protein [Salirhabdus euzebyi]MBB6452060.1 putative membrane protein YdjX (TVP38/TMEM64 family) [Salirhabdus euzebyi]
MEQLATWVLSIVESSGMFAPMLFIGFHLLRPIFFMPVAFICVSGGILFGMVSGTIYSVIGITLSSIFFYRFVVFMPKTFKRLVRMKSKIIGKHTQMSQSQIVLLRLMPFIHFHLLSVCIIEMSKSYKEYVKLSVLSNVPLAVLYTSFGQWISTLSPVLMVGMALAFLPMIYLVRRKEIVIKWEEFFKKEDSQPGPVIPYHQRG